MMLYGWKVFTAQAYVECYLSDFVCNSVSACKYKLSRNVHLFIYLYMCFFLFFYC